MTQTTSTSESRLAVASTSFSREDRFRFLSWSLLLGFSFPVESKTMAPVKSNMQDVTIGNNKMMQI